MRRHLEDLSQIPFIVDPPLPAAVLLHSTPFRDKYIFSCAAVTGRYESGKRTIVTLQRDGRWHCQSCRYSDSCKHRPHAILYALTAGFITEDDTPTSSSSDIDNLEADDRERVLLLRAAGRSSGMGVHDCISSASIAPPRWCSFPSETSYTAPKRLYELDKPLSLDVHSRCSCGAGLSTVPCPSGLFHEARLYDTSRSYLVSIELLACSVCRHARRKIGPDLGDKGIFNWNNTMLFTHDLLNAFTNAYTASETPFAAFCLNVRRSYQEHGFEVPFCSEETFVRVWFAFIQLQELDSGMKCPTCGPTPKVVIADGVSLGTQRSKLTASVSPPTRTSTNSDRVDSISTWKSRKLPTIPQKDIRTSIQRLLEATKTHMPDQLPDLRKITDTYPVLHEFIRLYIQNDIASPHYRSYRNLIQQIAAPDIVLQLVPYRAIEPLRSIEQSSTSVPDWLQCYFPAFGHVILSHRQNHVGQESNFCLPIEVRRLAGWLASCAEDVYARLAQHDPAPPQNLPAESWQSTGTYYGLPAIRRRRVYTKLRYDAQPLDRDEDEMGDCNKFYKTYSKNNLTGGILVLWCTHSICLGFHAIPVAEGRNDVFSAIYTRFAVAPEVIIYDFACQLAPYCLVREAKYFRNTRFLIDEMHAHDHTRCGPACFASNSMRFDDTIRAINTSAGECGNKGIRRIRKSVSFMIYEHAVVFTKAYLDVWNRNIIERMQKLSGLGSWNIINWDVSTTSW